MGQYDVTTAEQLLGHYGEVSFRAARKVHGSVDQHDRDFIARSPFLVLATVGELPDVSPRGDLPGFVQVLDDGSLLVPDRRGNNRIDSLLNVVQDPRVALIFLIPGVGESLRVNGTAAISADPALLSRCAVEGSEPATVLVVTPVEVLMQCPRALKRSRIWDPSTYTDPDDLAPMDVVLADQIPGLSVEESIALGRASGDKPLW
ncbi:MAG: pyridoxine 5-phosphate oxidase-like flavin-nucleotide-binding protein [Frankiales bacterium]|nr:pyridoxine 5-phosphate oxidase-like flavin-nucleotide-binding protein [Frankiales bacterium]